MAIEVLLPSIIKIGGGAFAEAAETLKRLGTQRPLIVTDAFLVRSGLAERLRAQLEAAGIGGRVFAETVPDPTTEAVAAGVSAFQEGGHDGLVSLGGGSPIDTAKAIGMLAANGGRARDYKVPNAIPKKGPAHLSIPTTAGTGSEVSRFTVITDSETDEKMLIAGAALVPERGNCGLRADDDDAGSANGGYGHGLADARDRIVCEPQGERVHRCAGTDGDEDDLGGTADGVLRAGESWRA